MILGYSALAAIFFLFVILVHHCVMYDNLVHKLEKLDREIYAIRNERYFRMVDTRWSPFRQTKKPQLKVVPHSTTRWGSAKRRAKRNGTYTGGKFRSKVY